MITESVIIMLLCVFAFIPLILGEKSRSYRNSTLEDFVLQGRTLGIIPMYFTIFATWMSAYAFIGGVTYFFEQGPLYMTTVGWDMLFAILFIVLGKRIWYYGKAYGFMSAVDFLDNIYGSPFLNKFVILISIISTLFYLQAQITAATLIVQVSTDNRIPISTAGLIFFTILIIYLWAGGLRAVALTDIFYGLLIVIAMISAGIFLIQKAGGSEEVFNTLIRKNAATVSMQGATGPERMMRWIAMFIIVPLGAFMGPPIWIRNYSAKSSSHFNILPLLLGISSIVCIGTLFSGSALQILSDGTQDSDVVMLSELKEVASPYFTAFIIIGMFAAIYSTANSQVHALASVFTNDIFKRYINKNASDRVLTNVAKWSVFAVCLLSYTLMMLFPNNLLDLAMIALGAMAQLVVPVAGALFFEKSKPTAAISGLVSGEACFFLFIIMGEADSSICAAVALLLNIYMFILTSYTGKGRADIAARINRYKTEYKAASEKED